MCNLPKKNRDIPLYHILNLCSEFTKFDTVFVYSPSIHFVRNISLGTPLGITFCAQFTVFVYLITKFAFQNALRNKESGA